MSTPTEVDDAVLNAQQQNWENFCQYHLGDWDGTWTRYSSQGEALDSFQCVRSFHLSEDGNQINHKNHYTYADGKSKTEAYGPYKRPITRALYLQNSFSWGSTTLNPGNYLGFETGFRFENKRASAIAMLDDKGKLQEVAIVSEHLGSFANRPPGPPANKHAGNWQESLQTMTPNWMVSAEVELPWKILDDLAEEYLTLHFAEGISLSCPQLIKPEQEFFLAVDWLISPTLLQRGIRHFDKSGFTHFTLQTFINES